MPLEVTVYNVGLGDCILLRFPSGEMALVDSNTPSVLGECPAKQDILDSGGRLRFVCLTHPHSDHYSGLMSILADPGIVVDEFWHSTSTYLELLVKWHNERSVPYFNEISKKMYVESKRRELLDIFDHLYRARIRFDRQLSEFQLIEQIGGVGITVLAPAFDRVDAYARALAECAATEAQKEPPRRQSNDTSIVLLLSYGDHRVLLGGDATASSWKHILGGLPQRGMNDVLPICYLKAPHHGAEDAYYPGMWEELFGPKIVTSNLKTVVVSSGGSRHPSPGFVSSLTDQALLYCTNRGGCHGSPLADAYPEGTPLSFLDERANARDEADDICYGRVAAEFEPGRPPRFTTERFPLPPPVCRSTTSLGPDVPSQQP